MYKNRTDRYEAVMGKKSVDKMLQIVCKCGNNCYNIYFDYEFCRYVIECNCGERRSIEENSIPNEIGELVVF